MSNLSLHNWIVFGLWKVCYKIWKFVWTWFEFNYFIYVNSSNSLTKIKYISNSKIKYLICHVVYYKIVSLVCFDIFFGKIHFGIFLMHITQPPLNCKLRNYSAKHGKKVDKKFINDWMTTNYPQLKIFAIMTKVNHENAEMPLLTEPIQIQ